MLNKNPINSRPFFILKNYSMLMASPYSAIFKASKTVNAFIVFTLEKFILEFLFKNCLQFGTNLTFNKFTLCYLTQTLLLLTTLTMLNFYLKTSTAYLFLLVILIFFKFFFSKKIIVASVVFNI